MAQSRSGAAAGSLTRSKSRKLRARDSHGSDPQNPNLGRVPARFRPFRYDHWRWMTLMHMGLLAGLLIFLNSQDGKKSLHQSGLSEFVPLSAVESCDRHDAWL